LRHAADDADDELLLGLDPEHFVPDARALVARCSVRPVAVKRGELLYFRNVGRLPGLAARFVVLAELRPLQLELAGRRELIGRGIGRRQAVLEAAPHRHEGFAGEDAIAERLALGRLAEELDANLAPSFPDELEHIGLLG